MIAPRDTPIEVYRLGGVDILVKREDQCWPYPPISKARGVYKAAVDRPGVNLAVVDTGRSLNGLIVITIGLELGRKVTVGYPTYVNGTASALLPALKSFSGSGNVALFPLQANRQFVMLAEMRRLVAERTEETGEPWFVYPTGLRLPETTLAVEEEMRRLSLDLRTAPGTVVIPTGTGTHLAGILRAYSGDVVAVQGYSRPEPRFRADVERMAGCDIDQSRLRVITSLHDYYEVRPDLLPPFPASMHYECRAWSWLRDVGPASLKQPIIFWNIGQ